MELISHDIITLQGQKLCVKLQFLSPDLKVTLWLLLRYSYNHISVCVFEVHVNEYRNSLLLLLGHYQQFGYLLDTRNSPEPLNISARQQSDSPGSLQSSTTSLHSVSGVMGTSLKCWLLLLRYTVRNIYNYKIHFGNKNSGFTFTLFQQTTFKLGRLSSMTVAHLKSRMRDPRH